MPSSESATSVTATLSVALTRTVTLDVVSSRIKSSLSSTLTAGDWLSTARCSVYGCSDHRPRSSVTRTVTSCSPASVVADRQNSRPLAASMVMPGGPSITLNVKPSASSAAVTRCRYAAPATPAVSGVLVNRGGVFGGRTST